MNKWEIEALLAEHHGDKANEKSPPVFHSSEDFWEFIEQGIDLLKAEDPDFWKL